MADVDLMNRDPNNLNDHVGVKFEDVLGEPDESHSADCVWRNSYKCFTCCKSLCYTILTFLCGIPMAFCWGASFAIVTFQHIWYFTPYMKCLSINCVCAQKLFATLLQCFLVPICDTCAICFSKINVKNG